MCIRDRSEILTDESSVNHKTYLRHPTPTDMFFEYIDEEFILDYVSNIPRDKSIFEEVPLRIYQQLVPLLIKPITHIANLSLSTGVVPDSCKMARVTAIFKAGDKADPGNYRPISILPLLCKILEKCVYDQLLNHIDDHKILTHKQYGFRKNFSTVHLMIDLFDKLYKNKNI